RGVLRLRVVDNAWQVGPGCRAYVHHEELFHRQMLACHRIHQFGYSLRIEIIAFLVSLERIASVEQLVLGEVHHHLTLAGFAANGINLELIGPSSNYSLAIDELEHRWPRRLLQAVGF